MTRSVDTTTKLSYLLPTGTFLTFQVLAPLATNNGKCGLAEQILTGVTLFLLVLGCVLTSFTDSYTAPDNKVYNGFVTRQGLWVPGGYDVVVDVDDHDDTADNTVKRYVVQNPNFELQPSDYLNAALSSVAFLTLSLFTDPVAACFYPNLSETLLKTLPVLLTALLTFICSFSGQVRRGYGNSYPALPTTPPQNRGALRRPDEVPAMDETHIRIKEDGLQTSTKLH